MRKIMQFYEGGGWGEGRMRVFGAARAGIRNIENPNKGLTEILMLQA
jgi:hypothetical protein